MAYGTSAGVTLLIGAVDIQTFTSTNITAAIVLGDAVVDSINSSASAAKKTSASNVYAAHALRAGRATFELKGLSSVGGVSGRAAKGGSYDIDIPPLVYKILAHDDDAPHFNIDTPSSLGEW